MVLDRQRQRLDEIRCIVANYLMVNFPIVIQAIDDVSCLRLTAVIFFIKILS